ncbi:MAG TPA: lipoyl synthase [candidate division WOR-3 bacterium]|uniref:Lipoyl synthase n=1 Tax=candidate division WOR-3 bacterium TaxID=2052148 RepID=A0A7V0XFJ4_UNCW3|nr:lipoyl synthase [candidate division WOR-3 bacterium]
MKSPQPGSPRKPDWLRARLPRGEEFERVNARLRDCGLNTVCSSARCPNLAECWNRGTATFLILGDVCTRHCRFCSVATGVPDGAVDETEPERVAAAVATLGLRYVVLTSVDRDDLEDLGAGLFAATVRAVRARTGARVELLTPDFGGREPLIARVLDTAPAVFGHNLETVERLSPAVRDPRADYRRSLAVLAAAKRLAPDLPVKSGLLVGLGESDAEVSAALADLRGAGCDIVTIGQYLRPARHCLPVARYVEPDRFRCWEEEALTLGFRTAFCGPLVRSSYLADRLCGGGS